MSYIIEVRIEVSGSKREADAAAKKVAREIERGAIRDAVNAAGARLEAYTVDDPIPRRTYLLREYGD